VYEANNHAGIVTFVVTESNVDFEAYQFNQTTQTTYHFAPPYHGTGFYMN
jgi:hypothetical protein